MLERSLRKWEEAGRGNDSCLQNFGSPWVRKKSEIDFVYLQRLKEDQWTEIIVRQLSALFPSKRFLPMEATLLPGTQGVSGGLLILVFTPLGVLRVVRKGFSVYRQVPLVVSHLSQWKTTPSFRGVVMSFHFLFISFFLRYN